MNHPYLHDSSIIKYHNVLHKLTVTSQNWRLGRWQKSSVDLILTWTNDIIWRIKCQKNEVPPVRAQSGSLINSPQKRKSNFQNPNWNFLSPILSLNFHFFLGGGGVAHQPTFDAKSKNAKISISIWGGGGWLTSQLLMPSPKMLKSQFPFSGRGGGCSPANFWCQVQKC